MPVEKPFNPLDKLNLAESIGAALYSKDPVPLHELPRFNGADIYSLFYVGDFPSYNPLSIANRSLMDAPIYVGKADAHGKRKGGFLGDSMAGSTLWKRLSDHALSIECASNLNVNDFFCRYLVIDDLWISLGESLLISKHSPVWNKLVDGFGNHNPGKGRLSGMRSRWDTLHPGRSWAANLRPNSSTKEQIENEVYAYLVDQYPSSRIISDNPISFGSVSLRD